ncbi:hypothetical protein IWQ60_010314, partial [Tieghemiomyces parasiticus]
SMTNSGGSAITTTSAEADTSLVTDTCEWHQPSTSKPLAHPNDPRFHHSVKHYDRHLLVCTNQLAWPKYADLANTYTGQLSYEVAKLDTRVVMNLTDYCAPQLEVNPGAIPSESPDYAPPPPGTSRPSDRADDETGFDLLLYPENVRLRHVTSRGFPNLMRYLGQTEVDVGLLQRTLNIMPASASEPRPSNESATRRAVNPFATEAAGLRRPIQVEPLDRNVLLVCTHGTRDCRCAEVGEPFYRAVADEIRHRRWDDKWQAARVSHIGGHVYASNVIHYPSGNWYGLLKPRDTPRLLDTLGNSEVLWDHWRGRQGISQPEQLSTYTQFTPATLDSATDPALRPAATFVNLTFNLPRGQEKYVQVELDTGSPPESSASSATINPQPTGQILHHPSLMEVAKAHGIEIEASCGGQCECATCHLIVENPKDYAGHLPGVSEAEEDMLEYAVGREEGSRLSCQIPVKPELDGLRLRVPV